MAVTVPPNGGLLVMAVVIRYDSIPEFVEHLQHCNGRGAMAVRNSRDADSRVGGLTFDRACEVALKGDPTHVESAQALINCIEAETPETPVNAWVPNVAGAFACVPEYLQGSPDCMRTRTSICDESNPIALYLPVGAMAAVNPPAILARGLACLALTLKLQSYRPVELFIYHSWHATPSGRLDDTNEDVIQVIKIETRPLALDTACFALTSPAFLRKLCFVGAYQEFPNSATAPMRPEKVRRLLGLPEVDLMLPRLQTDADMGDPVDWVRKYLKVANRKTV